MVVINSSTPSVEACNGDDDLSWKAGGKLPRAGIASTCSDGGAAEGDGSVACNSAWRIALYYIYFDLTPSEVVLQIEFNKKICEAYRLNGRIRISTEGINGVLSGTYHGLKEYEKALSCRLKDLSQTNDEDVQDDPSLVASEKRSAESCIESDGTVFLDVKYCHLRRDIPLEKQLFDRLIVKETKYVIGLFDQSTNHNKKKRSAKLARYRRNRERKREEQESRRLAKLEKCNLESSDESITSDIEKSLQQMKLSPELDRDRDMFDSMLPTGFESIRRAVMEEPLEASAHLSPIEWNERLDRATSSGKSALLLDVRNVYEMKVGHFAHPDIPTLLTNTRKYSDLPKILASNQEVQERDQIFMYCTGGVRCERVSMLVQKLYPEKEIFQLKGGIQRYLEACSKHEESYPTNTPKRNPSYFMGKNFVFDPRRTDPIHFGETVGRCIACDSPHDDYDNGHAPSDNREARCNNCRMLVLICDDCRPKFRCHGEENFKSQQHLRPLLYCDLNRCVHEGSSPNPELRTPEKSNA